MTHQRYGGIAMEYGPFIDVFYFVYFFTIVMFDSQRVINNCILEIPKSDRSDAVARLD